jgi:adenine-specific DNA-methyltransferase
MHRVQILMDLFPETITEGVQGKSIDFETLRELLDTSSGGSEERFGLGWVGKRAAGRLALTPSSGTLLPTPDQSVDWNRTKNIVIEGDNLEVLKLLQGAYRGKVKVIYIDPPYNTGSDFVYKDSLHDSIGNYERLTGQRSEEGVRLTSNIETSGRFHTDWLNMIYPRLLLAKNLLRADGIIFISIDDRELDALLQLLRIVFGEENFIATFVWKRRSGAMDATNNVSTDHEYVVCYSRSNSSLAGGSRTFERYDNPDDDSRGPWIADNLSAGKPGGDTFYPITDPATSKQYWPPKGRYWPYSPATMAVKISEGRVIFPSNDGKTPLLKRFQNEAKSTTQPVSTWIRPVAEKRPDVSDQEANLVTGYTSEGTRVIKDLFGDKVFTYAKPLSLLKSLIAQGDAGDDGLILDFFAGSGSLGHAVMEHNLANETHLRYILVQLPEPLREEVDEQKPGAQFCKRAGMQQNIAELTKERIRRAAIKIKAENPLFHGDVGFRVFKLDTTSIRPWDPMLPVNEQRLLSEADNILPGRTEQDLLYELLLKRGLELTVPIVERTLAGKKVFAVSTGDLIACLAPHIESADVEALAEGIVTWHKELAPPPAVDPNAPLEKPAKFDPPLVVFRDTAFADDVAKSNLTEILKQHSLTDVRSL